MFINRSDLLKKNRGNPSFRHQLQAGNQGSFWKKQYMRPGSKYNWE